MFFLGTIADYLRERRRNIFRYRDGFRLVRADPVLIGRRLEERCPDYQSLLTTLASDPGTQPPGPLRQSVLDQQKAAARDLAAVARDVFGLLELSPTGKGGVTDGEAVGVLTRYFLFMERLAEDVLPFATSPGAESSSTPAVTIEFSADSGTEGKSSKGE